MKLSRLLKKTHCFFLVFTLTLFFLPVFISNATEKDFDLENMDNLRNNIMELIEEKNNKKKQKLKQVNQLAV